jgi:cation diffusion facilitator family transporter
MKIFGSITNRFIPKGKESARVYRSRIGKFQGWVSVFVNGLLFIIKFIIGIIIGSVSVIADAIHTLSDVISSGVVIWGFHEAEKPADSEHPYGHGRVEYIATLIIAILLIVVGFEFIKSSITRILNPSPISPSWLMIIIILATVFLKELTARYAEFLAHKISSGTLHADAWHHRADAISSLLVIVAMIAGKYGYHSVDGWAGIGVALFVIWTGYTIAKEAIDDIIGTPPAEDEINDIKQVVSTVKGVLGVHDITVHSYGKDKFVSIHVEIDETISSAKAHDIAEDVEIILYKRLEIEPTVHIDPISVNNPMIKKVNIYLENNWKDDKRITGWHDIRIVDTEKHHVILFGINTKAGLTKVENIGIRDVLINAVKKQFNEFDVNIRISPIHRY